MFSQQLIAELKRVRAAFPKIDPLDRVALIGNLVLMFHIIRASERLLTTAHAAMDAADPLRGFFASHLEEERGHERWLRADLMSADVDPLLTMIPRQVVELVGSQYYLIHHVDPAALLGYMALLECFPVSLPVIEALERSHGTELLRTARFHAEHDIDHGRDLQHALDALPAERQLIVRQSATQSAVYLRAAFAAVL